MASRRNKLAEKFGAAGAPALPGRLQFQSAQTYRFPLRLTGAVAEEYAAIAAEQQSDIEEVMEQRLTKCRTHDAAKPLYFDDAQRQELEQLLARNFSSADEVLEKVRSLTRSSAGGVDIQFTPQQIERLSSRAIGVPYPEYVEKLVQRAVNAEIGLY